LQQLLELTLAESKVRHLLLSRGLHDSRLAQDVL
jgi:hypothetical protein